MDLWIRSQDKEKLIKVDRLTIDDTNSIFCDYNDFYLGTYKTKERAFEVLDEIQENLEIEQFCLNNIFVYKMPEE